MKLGVCVLLFLTVMPAQAFGQKQTEVPFRLIDGWAVVVKGTLGSVPNRTILIDTGAVPSAISRKAANALGLLGPAEQVSVMNRAVGVQRVRVPNVQVGPVAVEAIDMVATDLGTIEKALHTGLDAAVGLDLLGSQNFTIDYRGKQLLFGVGVHSPDSVTFQIRHAAGGTYLLVPMDTGNEKFQMLLDTGTKDITLFRVRLTGSLRQASATREELNVNAGGSSLINRVVIPWLRLGSIPRTKQNAYVWTTPETELRDFDGLVGPAALGVVALEFDFDRNTITLLTR